MTKLRTVLMAVTVLLPATASANIITDWDEIGVAVTSKLGPPQAQRMVAMAEIAMFDAVNSIEPRYKPYLGVLPGAAGASKEAAAASAAAAVLAAELPDAAAEIKAGLAKSLAALPDDAAKANGIKLGEAAARKMLEARAKDGATAPDAYRPKTRPGIYIPTPITAASTWPNVTPFAMKSPAQFRPKPPIALKSEEWAANYNEVKELGGKGSTKRTAKQTEDAQFWLLTGPPSYHPVARQIAIAKKMSVVDSARFMAIVAIAANDAYIAVFDAKYRYDFWRPITAIRNGDIDGNSATEREATWQPIAATPMHPEYPCAHCITSGAVAAAIEAMLGTADMEFSTTSATAPGVTHSWRNLWAYADEVATARIYAGFHWRFSTVVGQEMGRKIGRHAVKTVLQPTS